MMMGLTRLSSSLRVWPMRLTLHTDTMTLVQDKKMRGKKMTACLYYTNTVPYQVLHVHDPAKSILAALSAFACAHTLMVAQVALNHLDIGTYELSSLGFKLLHLPFGSDSEFDTTVSVPSFWLLYTCMWREYDIIGMGNTHYLVVVVA